MNWRRRQNAHTINNNRRSRICFSFAALTAQKHLSCFCLALWSLRASLLSLLFVSTAPDKYAKSQQTVDKRLMATLTTYNICIIYLSLWLSSRISQTFLQSLYSQCHFVTLKILPLVTSSGASRHCDAGMNRWTKIELFSLMLRYSKIMSIAGFAVYGSAEKSRLISS